MLSAIFLIAPSFWLCHDKNYFCAPFILLTVSSSVRQDSKSEDAFRSANYTTSVSGYITIRIVVNQVLHRRAC